MALDKERLLNLAYRLLEEPGWPQGSEKPGNTAVGTVAGIFRKLARLPAGEDRLHQALSLIEKLPKSPLARYSMRSQYQRILEVLRVRNGRTNHPALKNLSFEELAYVIGWVNRLHRAAGIPAAPPAAEATGQPASRKNVPAGKEGRLETDRPGKHGKAPGEATAARKTRRVDADDIDPRWAALKN
jgi:hypothetical protein